MPKEAMNFTVISEEQWNQLRSTQAEILSVVNEIKKNSRIASVPTGYITAKEFMEAIRIKRTKFDQMVQEKKIIIVKKRRKIYVPTGEIDRYFRDKSIP